MFVPPFLIFYFYRPGFSDTIAVGSIVLQSLFAAKIISRPFSSEGIDGVKAAIAIR